MLAHPLHPTLRPVVAALLVGYLIDHPLTHHPMTPDTNIALGILLAFYILFSD